MQSRVTTQYESQPYLISGTKRWWHTVTPSYNDGFLDLELPLYHRTDPNAYQQIAEKGFSASHETPDHRKIIREDIEKTAAELGITVPVERHECIFFHPFFEHVRDKTCVESDDRLTGSEVIITVEGDAISSDIYVADYHMYDCAYHLTWKPSPDSLMQVDSRKEAMRSYLSSITKVESRSDLETACSDTVTPEVLIEEYIKPDCIREVVLKKEIQCSGGLPVLASNYRRKWPLCPRHFTLHNPVPDGLLSSILNRKNIKQV